MQKTSIISIPYKYSAIIICCSFVIGIQSCAGTEFGKELAESFDSTRGIDDTILPRKKSIKKAVRVISNKDSRKLEEVVDSNPKKIKVVARNQKNRVIETRKPFKPQPYRITIQLSAADPSAPAESVTKALRGAGVSFEVEKIERVLSNSLRE
ncbi:hypothetical protein [Prochlorococcus sp. MIT 1300]|uniref:hypothetical protein n=1 Tax=Prochlorococcus sp. MIT 1300 TaxID=3096218 RepID=UPI002A76284C|nr:hypothetical protein [Prochlorococcus sp. MIT 1300]